MTITEEDKLKAKELANQLKEMATWLATLGSSTEPEEVEIDLRENNPEKRPEWWRELEHLERIEESDVFKKDGGEWRHSGCCGNLYETREMRDSDAGLFVHLRHYRLRPWREMEAGERIEDGDEYQLSHGVWCMATDIGGGVPASLLGRYRTRRPKAERVEPELRLPDGTDISGWPEIQEGEKMHPGDARFYPHDRWRLWGSGVATVTHLEFKAGNKFRRRVLACRHCGGNASLSRAKHWYCWSCGCQGPHYDESAVKWNEQNRKEGE